MAPEVVNNKNHGYGLAADIWGLGCTVLEMLTRQHPYSPLEGFQALYRIGHGELPPVPNTLSSDAQDFIFKCLQVNPENRPAAIDLLNHPFVKRPPPTPLGTASPHSSNRRNLEKFLLVCLPNEWGNGQACCCATILSVVNRTCALIYNGGKGITITISIFLGSIQLDSGAAVLDSAVV
ncbi:Protein kinase domain, partial [Dillenia turbinata]